MRDALFQSMALVNASGYAIIAAIVLLAALGIGLTFWIRARYGRIAADLRERADGGVFDTAVLNQIARDTRAALQRSAADVNAQAIIEHNFQAQLRGLMIGERFVRSCTGLLVILGLVGTFYGLTLSIGKLAALVSGDAGDASAITESLIAGLTQALTGMSVAFSSSLFGIVAAIAMTLLGVFFSVADRRNELMAQVEDYLDNALRPAVLAALAAAAPAATRALPGGGGAASDGALAAFEQSVARLDGVVAQFETALSAFATTTRDFREFNLHLKDNVQRMSLSFGDLSETLKEHARAIKPRA
jgi:hypothetical protein